MQTQEARVPETPLDTAGDVGTIKRDTFVPRRRSTPGPERLAPRTARPVSSVDRPRVRRSPDVCSGPISARSPRQVPVMPIAPVTAAALFAFAATAGAEDGLTAKDGPPPEPATSPPADSRRLDPSLWAPVVHRTRGIRPEEREAYYRILGRLRGRDPELLARRARRFLESRHAVSADRDRPFREFRIFADMFRNPEQYAGHPVRLRGYLRKLVAYPAGENAFGLDTLYEGWLFTEHSQGNPVVVVTTDLPEQLRSQIGSDLINGVEVTGYFFKLYGYEAGDAVRLAPLVLAPRMQWNPPRDGGGPSAVAAVSAVALIVGIVGIVWYWHRQERQLRRIAAERSQGPPPELGEVESTASPAESPPSDDTGHGRDHGNSYREY